VRVVPGGKARGVDAPAADRAAGARPRLAVTLGDPRGVGPAVVAKALTDEHVQSAADLVTIGPSGTGVDVSTPVGDWRPGLGAAAAGQLAGLAIEHAVRLVMSGAAEGLVTAPLDKAALLAGGYILRQAFRR
jgi:4-hydroxythreonine-4-phosphate dehydrogenase